MRVSAGAFKGGSVHILLHYTRLAAIVNWLVGGNIRHVYGKINCNKDGGI